MRRSISPWWPPRQRMSRHTQEPGSGLFQGLRMRLTLWYCGMVGMALVLFGVVLYFGIQYFLLTPIETDAALQAHIHAELWLTGSLDRACPFLVSSDQSGSSPGQGLPIPEGVVCFDQYGSMLAGEYTTGLPAAFLSTPLTLLRADAEVLLRSREGMAAEDAPLLEDIVAEANHMADLANNLLTLARLDSRSSHQEHEVVRVASLAEAGARRVLALAGQTKISIEVDTDEKAVVIGDPALLEQAVLALLDNAINYNRAGGRVMVRTAVKDEQALLEVEDTGIDIASEHLSHLGERFYRVDKARSREAGGTGLGLSIVRGIARAHGGTLTLMSIPDQGTTVTLTLSLAHRTVTARKDEAPGNVSALSERTV